MAELTAEGLRAGALGFSTSRTLNHRAADGQHIPTLRAEEAELTAIAHAHARGRHGLDADRLGLRGPGRTRSACSAGWRRSRSRPVTIIAAAVRRPARRLARRCWPRSTRPTPRAAASPPRCARGRPACCWASSCRRTRSWAGRATRRSPICRSRERLAQLRQPEFRARILAEAFEGSRRAQRRVERWDRMFPLGDPPDYEPTRREQHRRARGARRAARPRRSPTTCCSSATAREMLYLPVTNYAGGNLDVVREMIAAPNTLLGLGDGGAHVGIMCDATATSYTLTHWTRDRGRGALFPVSWAIKRLAADNAAAIGLNDRGLLEAGMKADINIIDYDRPAPARARGRLRPAGRRQAAGPAHRRLRRDHRLRRRRLSPRRGDRGAAGPPDPRVRGGRDDQERLPERGARGPHLRSADPNDDERQPWRSTASSGDGHLQYVAKVGTP